MQSTWVRIAVIGFFCALFGFLMCIRQDLPSLWMRVGIGAAAGAVIGVASVVCRRPSVQD